MTNQDVMDKLTEIFRRIFDDDKIVLSESSNAADIEEWDSLNQIKIILACEEAFAIPLNARRIAMLQNVGEMVAYIQSETATR